MDGRLAGAKEEVTEQETAQDSIFQQRRELFMEVVGVQGAPGVLVGRLYMEEGVADLT
jgi:hypothetical protein